MTFPEYLIGNVNDDDDEANAISSVIGSADGEANGNDYDFCVYDDVVMEFVAFFVAMD